MRAWPWLVLWMLASTACGARTGLDVGVSSLATGDAAGPDSNAPVALDPASVNPQGPLPEICNGLDDDWNGVIDDGFTWRVEPNREDVRVSTDNNESAETSGLASDGSSYVAFYEGGTSSALKTFATPLGRDGTSLRPEQSLTVEEGQAHGGNVHGRAIAWNGGSYGVAWIDVRDGYSEIYFALLDANGTKLQPGDVRLSYEGGFGFNPSVHWTGERFVVVWSDWPSTFDTTGGDTRIFARTISPDGSPDPKVIEVTEGIPGNHDGPFVTAAGEQIAVAWIASDDGEVKFALFDRRLQRLAGPLSLGFHGDFVRVVHLGSGWAAFWHGTDDGETTIWGVRLDKTGAILGEAQPVVETPKHARYPFPISLGDRVLLVYSDDGDEMQGYELYDATLSATLERVGPAERVTRSAADSIFPTAAFGPAGDVGILFRDDRLGWGQVFFTRLECE